MGVEGWQSYDWLSGFLYVSVIKHAFKYQKTYNRHHKELDGKPQRAEGKSVGNLQPWSKCRTRDYPETRNPFTDQGRTRPRNNARSIVLFYPLLKPKTYSALDHFRSISIQSEICHIVLRKSNASEMCFVLTKYPQKLEETFVLNYEDFQSEATFE